MQGTSDHPGPMTPAAQRSAARQAARAARADAGAIGIPPAREPEAAGPVLKPLTGARELMFERRRATALLAVGLALLVLALLVRLALGGG